MDDYRRIFVRGLRIDAEIGAYEHEFGQTQPLVIDFEISVTEPVIPDSDSMEDVLCYNRFSQSIQEIVSAGHIQLVETLAERICSMALTHPMVKDIRVRIDKLNAMDDADAAGVEVYKQRHG